MVSYDIVLVKPDKSEEIINTVETPAEVRLLVETASYAGTWISPTRKILRKGRGEIHVRERQRAMRVIEGQPHTINNMIWYKLDIGYSESLSHIIFNEYMFIGYNKDDSENPAWRARSMIELTKYVGKEVAYQASIHYERYLHTYELQDKLDTNFSWTNISRQYGEAN